LDVHLGILNRNLNLIETYQFNSTLLINDYNSETNDIIMRIIQCDILNC
jgi:hypothetical protein